MSHDDRRIELGEHNAEALLADGLEEALIGYARRCGQPTLAVYDYEKAIHLLVNGGASYEEAVEHLEHNVVGAWAGEHTPIFLHRFECDEELGGDGPDMDLEEGAEG